MTSLNVEEDQRHRRILTDELGRLTRYAESGPLEHARTISGDGAGTRFRVEELRTVTPESFRLDNPLPSIYLRASSTKNRKPADQPIAQSVARDLRDWIRDKPNGQSVFPLDHDIAKAIRDDLEAIRIHYKADEGIADFHSLRAYYISALVRSGESISEVHRLARQAKPETTLRYYAKVSKHDLHGAVETSPNPTSPESKKLAATGTDGQPISKLVSLHFPYGNDQTCLDKSSSDEMVARNDEPVALADAIDLSLENKASGDQSRLVTRLEAERGGFEPPKPVSQFNGLANRRYRPLSHLSRSATSTREFLPIIKL